MSQITQRRNQISHDQEASTVSALYTPKPHRDPKQATDAVDEQHSCGALPEDGTADDDRGRSDKHAAGPGTRLAQPELEIDPVADELNRHRGPSDAIWPSSFHSACVMLVLHIGTTEFTIAPQMAWNYGGFVFFLPVLFLVLVTSIPMHFLESVVGQYTSRSEAVIMPRLGPAFRGLGYAILMVTVITTVYYMAEAGWLAVYTYYAAQSRAQWLTCSPHINSRGCYTEALQRNCTDRAGNGSIYFDFGCVSVDEFCTRNGFAASNSTHCLDSAVQDPLSARWVINHPRPVVNVSKAELLWRVGGRHVSQRDFFYHFRRGQGEHDRPQLQRHRRKAFVLGYWVALLLAILPCFNLWMMSWLAVIWMVVSSVLMLLIMFRVFLFPGAWSGVVKFFSGKARLEYLWSSRCWADAIGVTFWSVDIGTGLNQSLSSRNRLRHNAFFTSTAVVLCDIAHAVFFSLLFFAVRGTLEYRSEDMRQQLQLIDSDSQALQFVAYTAIVDLMPNSQFWGVIYFGTMLLHTVGSAALIIIGIGFNLVDAVPRFGRRPFHVAALTACSPAILLCATLSVGVWSGIEWSPEPIGDIEWIVGNLLSTLVLGHKLWRPYFFDQLRDTLGQQIGVGLGRMLVLSWLVVTPVVTTVQLGITLAHYRWPPVQPAALWLVVISCIAMLAAPVTALVVTACTCWRLRGWALVATAPQFRPDPRALLELSREPVAVVGSRVASPARRPSA